MSKNATVTSDTIRTSVSSIYSDLLRKRTIEREQKEEIKRQKKEEERQRKAEKKESQEANLSKSERRKMEMDTWKEIVIGLTGDDLDYADDKKPKKKKYRQWIDDSSQTNSNPAPKKQKKRNYHKEFAPELNMLKNLVAEQNRFSADLLKRYQYAAGPNTKDGTPPNKTLVELIATINASRANSLGMLREIGNIKKTMADLYMKQQKLNADLKGIGSADTNDLALLGSSVASSIFDNPSPYPGNQQQMSAPMGMGIGDASYNSINGSESPQTNNTGSRTFEASSSFDPNSWEGPTLEGKTANVIYEAIPHHVVVEWHKSEDKARFKAVRDDNGEELVGAPLPPNDPSKLSFNEANGTVKGMFDEIYPLEIV